MKRKGFLRPLLISAVIITMSVNTVYAKDVGLKVNGVSQDFEQAPINQNGTLLVTGSEIAQILGATSVWDGNKKTVTITKGEDVAVFKSGSKTYTFNGKTQYLPIEAKATDGDLILPLKVVCQAFGANVGWDSTNNIVTISLEEKVSIESSLDKPADATIVLTYDQAVNKAVANNNDINKLNGNIANMEQQRKAMIEDYQNAYYSAYIGGNTVLELSRSISSIEATLSSSAQSKEIYETTAEQLLLASLNRIASYRLDIALMEETVKLGQENVKNVTLKNTYGMASDSDVKKAKQDLEKSKSSLKKLELGLNSELEALNQLLGYKPSEKVYVEYEPQMEPVTVNVQSYAISKTSTDPTIVAKEKQVESYKYALETTKGFASPREEELYNPEAEEADELKAQTNYDNAVKDLDNSKDVMVTEIYKTYDQLGQMEENQKTLGIELEKAKDNYETVLISYNAGLVTAFDVEMAEAAVMKIEADMLKNAYAYDTLKFAFENPFLLTGPGA